MAQGGHLPEIVAIGVGGSISTLGRDELDLVDYPTTQKVVEVDELIDRVAIVRRFAEIESVRFRAKGSSTLNSVDWLELHSVVTAVANRSQPPAGILITHGTATLEETAFFLHLSLKVAVPVVVVGSQRPTTAISSDAQLNLLNAVRVASHAAARGMGVLVVMNGVIHSARDVTKAHGWQLEAFQSPQWGPLGMVWPDGMVEFYRKPLRKHTITSEIYLSADAKDLPRVEIVPSFAGADGRLLDMATRLDAAGIVIEGLTPGITAAAQKQSIQKAVDSGVVVIQASRGYTGKVILQRPDRAMLISANDLSPQKARILATLVLGQTRDRNDIQGIFDSH